VWITLCTFGVAAVALAVGAAWVRSRRDGRRWLRRCPMCGDAAVRAAESYAIDSVHTLVRVQCGQCGIWRRVVTTHPQVRRLGRRLERDRRRIGACALRLARARIRLDLQAFARTLREQIVGADDFLALTRRRGRPSSPSARTREPEV
jgi:ribosomal protein S27AE